MTQGRKRLAAGACIAAFSLCALALWVVLLPTEGPVPEQPVNEAILESSRPDLRTVAALEGQGAAERSPSAESPSLGPIEWFVEGSVLGAEHVSPELFTLVVLHGPQVLLRLGLDGEYRFSAVLPSAIDTGVGEIQVRLELKGTALEQRNIRPGDVGVSDVAGRKRRVLVCDFIVDLGIVVRGRVVTEENSAPVGGGLVCLFAADAGPGENDEPSVRTRTAPDGTFVLCRAPSGPVRLAFLDEVLRPTTLDVDLLGSVDLGDVRLAPGASLSGWIARGVLGADAAVQVEVRLPVQIVVFHGGRSFGWSGGSLEVAGDFVPTASGAFEIGGLAEVPYHLRFGGLEDAGCMVYEAATTVIATPPGSGVRVDGPQCSAAFVVQDPGGDGLLNAAFEFVPGAYCFSDEEGKLQIFVKPGVAYRFPVTVQGHRSGWAEIPPLAVGEARLPEVITLDPQAGGAIAFKVAAHLGITYRRIEYCLVPEGSAGTPTSERHWKEAWVDDAGVFRVPEVPEGCYGLYLRLSPLEALGSYARFEPTTVCAIPGEETWRDVSANTGGRLAVQVKVSDSSAPVVCRVFVRGEAEPVPNIEFIARNGITGRVERSECCPLEVGQGSISTVVPALPSGDYVVRLFVQDVVVAEEAVTIDTKEGLIVSFDIR